LNSNKCDQQWRHYLREAGVYQKTNIHHSDDLMLILKAMEMFFLIESIKDFSKKHDNLKIGKEDDTVKTMDLKQKKESKAKVLANLREANHPYFIQILDGTLLPFCTMDCIRIFQKFKELIEEPESEPTLWSPIHYC